MIGSFTSDLPFVRVQCILDSHPDSSQASHLLAIKPWKHSDRDRTTTFS